MTALLHRSIVTPTGRHTASLIFLHGSGDTGVGVQSWVNDVFDRIRDKQGFKFRHIKVVYPTAPLQPYTVLNGRPSNVWYDRHKLSFKAPDAINSIKSMVERLSDVIQEEKNCGISEERIMVGGFSMGGSMAMQLAFTQQTNLKAVFGLSSFLSETSTVYYAIKEFASKNNPAELPELFMCHGTRDPVVSYDWGEKTFERLKSLGVKGQFHTYNYYHEIGSDEMVLLREWVNEMLPENPARI